MFQNQKDLKGDALMSLLFNFALEDAIMNVQENQEELICEGHISSSCHVQAVNFFDRNINTVQNKSNFIPNGGINSEISVEETKYTYWRHDAITNKE
jgi:hypothetical protein